MVRIDCSSWLINGEWASSIRRSVFIVEQGIDESEEWDEHDSNSVHALAWWRDKPVGTARLLHEGKIGRMAVLPEFRSQGIGSAMLLALLAVAEKQNLPLVRLSAQQQAIGFYSRHGFAPEGEPHEEVGIAHQWMVLSLTI
ncbi:GNAT family N-acetyltransferase [Limnobacter parvus]|uniref:GNAT family N-acetyltransferase n=1 Tax=Limnobacter parvus TaxID=2939690 RepID=A0ABT1XHY6_9BURK|nr:GNAT family N-acetyltransferase [Limnobacter parvus]MCR2745892.1 GNAT family N-acetyltransferase [Limnobacter parvus]